MSLFHLRWDGTRRTVRRRWQVGAAAALLLLIGGALFEVTSLTGWPIGFALSGLVVLGVGWGEAESESWSWSKFALALIPHVIGIYDAVK